VIDVDFTKGEHFSPEFLRKNPQGEVPVLEDDGFFLSESGAILQYLADKYKKDETFYPAEPKKRAVVNHRLAFNGTTMYKAIIDYMVLPTCYAYPRKESDLKKLEHAVKVLNILLEGQKGDYITGEYVTIADISLILSTVCLEVASFDMSKYGNVKKWYENFKSAQPVLWEDGKVCFEEVVKFVTTPPDYSKLNHPLHPTKREK